MKAHTKTLTIVMNLFFVYCFFDLQSVAQSQSSQNYKVKKDKTEIINKKSKNEVLTKKNNAQSNLNLEARFSPISLFNKRLSFDLLFPINKKWMIGPSYSKLNGDLDSSPAHILGQTNDNGYELGAISQINFNSNRHRGSYLGTSLLYSNYDFSSYYDLGEVKNREGIKLNLTYGYRWIIRSFTLSIGGGIGNEWSNEKIVRSDVIDTSNNSQTNSISKTSILLDVKFGWIF